jgi:hypothetical protein
MDADATDETWGCGVKGQEETATRDRPLDDEVVKELSALRQARATATRGRSASPSRTARRDFDPRRAKE